MYSYIFLLLTGYLLVTSGYVAVTFDYLTASVSSL